MPEVGNHAHAAHFQLGALGVLVLVNHVLADAQVHELVHLLIVPGLAESGQILAGVAIEQELGLDEFVSILRAHGAFRHGIGGQGT